MNLRKNIAVFIFAPSGGGKGHIKKYIQSHFRNYFYIPCEVTTRDRRGEDEFDRIFYTPEEFASGLKEGKIICPSKPYSDAGPSYGYIKQNMEKDLPILGEIEEENYENFKKIYGDKMYVFAIRWDMGQYKANILSRGHMSEFDLDQRLINAKQIHNDIDKMLKKGQIYKLYNVNIHYEYGIDVSDKEVFQAIVSEINKLMIP